VNGELLLEVRVEEIPARMLAGATRELATRVFEELMARGVPPDEIHAGFTPRRLWLTMSGLPEREEDREVVEIGPPTSVAFDAEGNPTAAAIGFAKRFGVAVESLVRVDPTQEAALLAERDAATPPAPKGERVVLRRTVEGAPLREILSELLPKTLAALSWAKTMRWGTGVGPWVRPVHGVVALLDGEVVPFDFFDVSAGRESAGHATQSPQPFEVADVGDWRRELAELGIVPEPEERERRLRAAMEGRAAAAGGELIDDPELLAKLAAICEVPGVLEGSFDPDLLDLPREVLTTSLRDHQSALTVEKDGALLPLFLTVMNRGDDPAGRVRAGNEWVVAARLADARFFWQKDRARPLAEGAAALDSLTFHERLGSYAEKSRRVVTLARRIARGAARPAPEVSAAERAAGLAKADLSSEMVREFTSLQGVMGGIYAREEGEPEAVWQAIYDQYRPAGSEDELPRGPVGVVVALADRLDTLVGFFALGPKFRPSGSKDPFGLRRAATGVVRLALEGDLELELSAVLDAALESYRELLAAGERPAGKRGGPTAPDDPIAALREFLWDRADYLLGIGGLAYDEIDAARGATGRFAALEFALARDCARALQAVRNEPSFLSVALAAKRIANITRDQPDHEVDSAALELTAERSLDEASGRFVARLDEALARRDFVDGLRAVGELAPALESFFDEVLVMDPDPAKRRNRLSLLQRLGREIQQLADLSRLVVEKADYR